MVVNTIIAAILIKCGARIHIVKLGSAFAFVLNPLLINIYTRRHYRIDKKVKPNMSHISQRWDALGHELLSSDFRTLVSTNAVIPPTRRTAAVTIAIVFLLFIEIPPKEEYSIQI